MAQMQIEPTAVRDGTQPRSAKRRDRRTAWQVLKANSGFLFILPAVLIFLIFGLYTVIYSIVLSFFQWNGFSGFSILPPSCTPPACQFVGLENYAEFLYKDPTVSSQFWQALQNNIIMAIVVTLGTIVVALPIAIALNRALWGQSLYRMVIMLPMVVQGIAIYYVWTFIYNSDGLLNAVLKAIGLGWLQAQNGWLSDPGRALPSLIVVMIWGAVPLATLLYLTGLQSIGQELFEAATIDGANAFQVLWSIIWPRLKPTTVIIIILSINSVLQSYEQVYLMTNGGPAGHTSVVGLQIFNFGFGAQRELGTASAMSWILFVGVFIVALINLRVFRSDD
ncbi:carbohydrate ABC transporter permease [Tengunoibacter tsumagoiensis]|uniref:Sugar ABC transporter permease n=1 Tax=Tengunoibacter tsumagoiensis TaxID=2014871 RepID=A0A402A4E1_9CHLR|nr:sugar ABC transporter permease [Tengunoibacter tsumagoiensis]GCE14024.1 sugar ABC transporter permease [Tengunoibacter tsumagoiensis]